VLWSLATVGVAVGFGEPAAGLFTSLFPAVLIVPIVVLLPAFAEELAWRGFALPRLMSAMSPLAASLVLAIPWSLVHVFLYVPGQFNGTLSVWPMIVSIFAYSIVLTWVYIGTGGSVLDDRAAPCVGSTAWRRSWRASTRTTRGSSGTSWPP
jgi:membrane protease YdiL (CAAX protease family)